MEAHIRGIFGSELSSRSRKLSESTSKFSGKSILPPIRDGMFPEIRSCMEEQDFHINIIKSKKKVKLHILNVSLLPYFCISIIYLRSYSCFFCHPCSLQNSSARDIIGGLFFCTNLHAHTHKIFCYRLWEFCPTTRL